MGSRASMRDDDIARAEFVVDSARQAVGDLMRKIEQVRTIHGQHAFYTNPNHGLKAMVSKSVQIQHGPLMLRCNLLRHVVATVQHVAALVAEAHLICHCPLDLCWAQLFPIPDFKPAIGSHCPFPSSLL